MTASPSSDVVVVEAELDAPPEKVWRALTEPALLAAWLSPNDMRAQVGADFRLDSMPGTDGPVDCQVLEADPPHTLRISWRGGETEPGQPASEVEFRLTPTVAGGALLRVVHSGLPRTVAAPAPAAIPANDTQTVMLRAA